MVMSAKSRKIIIWGQINQNTTVDWAKGEGDNTNNKKRVGEITGGGIPSMSVPRDNGAAYIGVDGATRVMADQFRGGKGSITITANPETMGIILTGLFGPPASSTDNGDVTYTHLYNISNSPAEHYGNFGLLDYQAGVNKRADGLRISKISMKSAGVDGLVSVTLDCIGKSCDKETGTNADLANGTGTHGFQRWGFSVAKTAASASGLANAATAYTCTVAADGGTPEAVSITGSAAQTLQLVIDGLNVDLTKSHAEWSDDGNGFIKIVSNTTGATSTIAIADTNLFATLTNANVAAETAIAGHVYSCPTLDDFVWAHCSFSSNGVSDPDINDVEITYENGMTERRAGSKYFAFPYAAGGSKLGASFTRYCSDSTYQDKVIAGTLHPLVWTIQSEDVIGTGSRNPSLTVTITDLYIRDMPTPQTAGNLEAQNIKGEAIRECADGAGVVGTISLVNTTPNYTISL